MIKFLKYLLFLVIVLLCYSCASSNKKSAQSKTHHPNMRKKPSGKTDNCDCGPGRDKRGHRVSRVHSSGRRR